MSTATPLSAADTRQSRLPWICFGLGALTSIFTVFIVWRGQRLVSTMSDPYGFAAMAHSLLSGNGFAGYGSVLSRRGPLYPAMIALVYLVTGEHPIAVQLVQALMLGAICALVYDVGRRLYNPRTGFIAAVLCAFHPALLRYVPDFHLETFFAFLSTVSIWRSVRFLESPSLKNGAYFGIAAGFAALVKPVVLLHPAVFVAYWLLVDRRDAGPARPAPAAPRAPIFAPQRLLAAAAIFGAMGVVILPWSFRNYRTSGHFVLVTTGAGDAFLRGFIFSKPEYALLERPPYTDAENECNVEFNALAAQAGTVLGRDDIETDHILGTAAKEQLRAHPGALVRKFMIQLFTFWYEMTNLANSLIAGGLALVFWVLALIGWRRGRQGGYRSWPLFVPILCLNLSLALLLALGRYSVPILPALAVLAAFGLDTLLPARWLAATFAVEGGDAAA
jgi:4-amino-4-deoxy-L-arabinose transferase-like glycosyltransferase